MKDTMNDRETQDRRTILSRVAALDRMTESKLHEEWRTLFGGEAPQCRPSVLRRRLAHRIQELSCGAPVEELRRRIEEHRTRLGMDAMGVRCRNDCGRANTLVTGTRLVREWGGVRCEVTVMSKGFEFQGKSYRSLSAVAKAITGTHWNGRAFFGLYKPFTGRGGRA